MFHLGHRMGFNATALDSYPTGMVMFGVCDTIPDGFIVCDGSYLDRVEYADLFAAIGTSFGTSLPTNFRLPIYGGWFPRFSDFGSGADPDYATRTDRGDGSTGAAVGTAQLHAIKSHTHEARVAAAVGYVASSQQHRPVKPRVVAKKICRTCLSPLAPFPAKHLKCAAPST